MYKVDLNSDLGESFGNYTIGNDDKVIPSDHISQCSLRLSCF